MHIRLLLQPPSEGNRSRVMPPLAGHEIAEHMTAALGADRVVTDRSQLRAAETATFEARRTIPMIVRPQTREQVQECVRVANQRQIALYPVSTGKNWGYGSSVPTADGCALVDLSGMSRILAFNERLGYVTVEPGVTQRQLYRFLREKGSRLWMDATGSSPDCSVIGNTVERGFGHTVYGDHFANVCGLEVVLPNGELLETGFAGLPGANAAEVYRWGAGPSLDGLFSQSNFGIVTRMTLWLMPAPEYFQAYFFQSGEEDSLAAFIEALRPLRMNGTLRSTVHIANDYKVLNGIQQFPWREQMPLSRQTMKQYQKNLKFGRWSGSGALYGSRGQVAEARKLLRRALAGKVSKLQFLDDRRLALAARFSKPYRWLTGWDLSRTLELVRPVYGLMKGIPTEATLPSAYWRKKMPVPEAPDPDRDGCGLIWYAPVAPADGASVTELARIAEDTLLERGFEPMISMTMIAERAVACVISIAYDRETPGEDAKAMACYEELRQRLTARGYYPYRLGIQSMNLLESDRARSQFLNTLKQSLDPNHILAPGRYLAQPAGARR
jgi:4-cresol dehydrogenase (hydroxylating) flavoprotein subunit